MRLFTYFSNLLEKFSLVQCLPRINNQLTINSEGDWVELSQLSHLDVILVLNWLKSLARAYCGCSRCECGLSVLKSIISVLSSCLWKDGSSWTDETVSQSADKVQIDPKQLTNQQQILNLSANSTPYMI